MNSNVASLQSVVAIVVTLVSDACVPEANDKVTREWIIAFA